MNSLSNLVAVVVCFVLIFFLNYLFYGVVAAAFFEEHQGSASGVMKQEVEMSFIALGTLVQAVVLTGLYARWSQGKHELIGGFKYGAMMGIFAGFGMALVMYGTSNLFDLTAHTIDGIWYLVLYGLCGAAIAAVMGRINKSSPT